MKAYIDFIKLRAPENSVLKSSISRLGSEGKEVKPVINALMLLMSANPVKNGDSRKYDYLNLRKIRLKFQTFPNEKLGGIKFIHFIGSITYI